MRRELAAAAALVAVQIACVDVEDTEPLSIGPLDTFASEVSPALSNRCASSACHGRPDRALALYAPGAHRLEPSQRFLDAPLTSDELTINAYQVAAFATAETASEALVLRKPLAEDAGGAWHGGGTVFDTAEDPLHASLVVWLEARGPP